MNYDTLHEKDAIATHVGKVMHAYFPEHYFVEEGCYILSGQFSEVLGIVSPDGSIRNANVDENKVDILDVVAAVEVKCPFPSEKRLGLHYTLPEYYVCQCLSEMVVLNTKLLIYVSYSEESTSFLKVDFCEDLWNMIRHGVIVIVIINQL